LFYELAVTAVRIVREPSSELQ